MIEVTYDDIEDEICYRYSSEYHMTFEDFYAMLKNMRDNKIADEKFFNECFLPFLCDIGDKVHFTTLFGYGENLYTVNLSSEYSCDDYITTDEAVFFDVFAYLECKEEDYTSEDRIEYIY